MQAPARPSHALARPLLAFALLALAGLSSACRVYTAEELTAEPVSVWIARHAETESSTLETRDPDLSDAGRQRAAALSKMLDDAAITHLFTSPFARTRQTVAPLAERTGLAVEEYDPSDIAGFAELLRDLPNGSVAVVAGHSNTGPALAFALCGDWPENLETKGPDDRRIPHDDYSRLYNVYVSKSPAATEPGTMWELELPAVLP